MSHKETMSHFAVLVITPNGTEAEAEDLLAPYSENLKVEPYDKACWCVGMNARKSVRHKVEQEMPIEKARTKFNEREDVKRIFAESTAAGNYGFSQEIDDLWDVEFVRPFEAREAELLDAHPGKDAADPECDECNGTGIENTTYNPNSKWDWYSLGGRWIEEFLEFQGEPVSKFIGAKNEDGSPKRTFVVITPDGRWLEKGRMLFFAVVSDKKDPQEWEVLYTETLEKYRDHKALYYDCHI